MSRSLRNAHETSPSLVTPVPPAFLDHALGAETLTDPILAPVTMHNHALQPHNHIAGRTTRLSDALIARAGDMAPRLVNVGPEYEPYQARAAGAENYTNATAVADQYTHGLAGVSQTANFIYVEVLIISFCGLLAITLLYRWLRMGNIHLRHLFTMGKWEDQRYWMHNHTHFWPRIKRNLIYAPLFRVRHNKEIQLSNAISMGTLPSRYHTLLLLLYLASNLAYCLALSWGENRLAILAELRGRTGALAALNLIPTVLFALRNNPLIPILGVSYDTFNLLHRWCARIVIYESVVHTICWAVSSMEAGGLREVRLSLAVSMSYQWGMVAMCALGVVLITSLGPLRHAFYETFLNVHRILVMVAIIGIYIHLDKANLPQVPYVQLCLAFWVAEWAWRSFRIIYHNVSRQKGITKVTIEALPAEACRVTFDLSRPWNWHPGNHVHVYLPRISLWSSHPFSIAWAESRAHNPSIRDLELEKLSGYPSESLKAPSVLATTGLARPSLNIRSSTYSRASMKGGISAAIAEKQDTANIAVPRDAGVSSVSLIMRARSGMTRKLYEKASASPTGTITTWGAIEGPYGGHESLTSYGTVVLFAGGVGITHCVGYVYHLLLQHAAGLTSTQKILLVWSIPNTESLEWVRSWMEKILRMEGRRDVLRIQIFVTKPRNRGEVISNTGSVQMFPGRCNPQTVLQKEMQERIGAMGVSVCGPGGFADAVRAAIREVVQVGSVDFVEEAFTY